LAITTGSLPSITATHELVVPKSIPIIFPMICSVFIYSVLSKHTPMNKGYAKGDFMGKGDRVAGLF